MMRRLNYIFLLFFLTCVSCMPQLKVAGEPDKSGLVLLDLEVKISNQAQFPGDILDKIFMGSASKKDINLTRVSIVNVNSPKVEFVGEYIADDYLFSNLPPGNYRLFRIMGDVDYRTEDTLMFPSGEEIWKIDTSIWRETYEFRVPEEISLLMNLEVESGKIKFLGKLQVNEYHYIKDPDYNEQFRYHLHNEGDIYNLEKDVDYEKNALVLLSSQLNKSPWKPVVESRLAELKEKK